MFCNYYKLNVQPFGVTPDPAFLFFSRTHREAMASLMYGVLSGRGFTALIAEPGMGKTSLLFNLLNQLKGSANTAFLFQTLGPQELLRALLADLGLAADGAEMAQMHAKLNEYLLHESLRGRHLVVVLDEAQNLGADTLEAVRMLSNFETADRKLVHVVLAGQPRLAETLALGNLVQLRQRVSIVARLNPFDREETKQYIDHRLRVAGLPAEERLFTECAYAKIAEYSCGVPRNINNLCFNAMSLGCALKHRTLDRSIVQEAIDDLDLEKLVHRAPVPDGQGVQGNVAFAVASPAAAKTDFQKWLRYGVLAVGIASFLYWPAYQAAELVRQKLSFQGSRTSTQVPTTAGFDLAGQTEGLESGTGGPRSTNVQADSVAKIEIRVKAKDSIASLCKRYTGHFDESILDEILKLNPSLKDPKRLKVGQILRIPVNTQVNRELQTMPESGSVPLRPAGQRGNR